MKRKVLKSFMSYGMMAALVLGSFAACGKTDDTGSDDASVESEETISPEEQYPSVISADDINPGSLMSEENLVDTSEHWYPEGDENSEYFFMLVQTLGQLSNVGMDLTYCKGHGDEYISAGSVINEENGHAKTEKTIHIMGDEADYDFDLTFQDNFTCYNFVDGKVYKRAHTEHGCKEQSWYEDAIKGRFAYREFSGKSCQKITFNDDFTFIEEDIDPDKTFTGTWEVKGSNLVDLYYDDPEAAGIYDAMDVSFVFDMTAGDAETENEGRWPMHFNIDADGNITDFGLYPTWDENGDKVIKSTYWFGTEAEFASMNDAEVQLVEDATHDDIDDLTGVDLDVTPAVVVTGYDEAVDFDYKNYKDNEYLNQVVEIEGTYTHGPLIGKLVWQNPEMESLSEEIQLNVSNVKQEDVAEFDSTIRVKGIVWKNSQNQIVICTDADHVTVK